MLPLNNIFHFVTLHCYNTLQLVWVTGVSWNIYLVASTGSAFVRSSEEECVHEFPTLWFRVRKIPAVWLNTSRVTSLRSAFIPCFEIVEFHSVLNSPTISVWLPALSVRSQRPGRAIVSAMSDVGCLSNAAVEPFLWDQLCSKNVYCLWIIKGLSLFCTCSN